GEVARRPEVGGAGEQQVVVRHHHLTRAHEAGLRRLLLLAVLRAAVEELPRPVQGHRGVAGVVELDEVVAEVVGVRAVAAHLADGALVGASLRAAVRAQAAAVLLAFAAGGAGGAGGPAAVLVGLVAVLRLVGTGRRPALAAGAGHRRAVGGLQAALADGAR